MTTDDKDPSPRDPNRPARGRNRVDPVQRDRLLDAVAEAGQGPYPAWSLLPPHPNSGDRWPQLGAPLSARAWQLAEWLNAETHTGRGALLAPTRREVARYLKSQGLDSHVTPQDLMRILASLAREPGAADEPLADDKLDKMLKAMKNKRGFAAWPGGSVGLSSRRNLSKTRLVIEGGAMPGLWGRYALRVVMHALGLTLEGWATLWLLNPALRRTAEDVSLAAHPTMASAASLLRRSWDQMLDQLLPSSGEAPGPARWHAVKALWSDHEPLFNPLRHTDSADPALVREWITEELAHARQRGNTLLVQRLSVWPARFADQVHAWAWAVARELMDGTRYGDFRLHEPVRLGVTLGEGEGPEHGPPNALHHLAVCFKQKRAKGSRLHHLPDAALHKARRATHHTHFRHAADHPPLAGLATPEAGRKLANGG